MTRLLFLNFIRSKGLHWGLGLLFFTGLLGINTGRQFLDKYQENVKLTAKVQEESIENNVKNHPQELGLLLYYVKFGLVNEMPNLAGLSIGQRDINPSVQSVNIRYLEEQKYNTDLINPLYSLLGNLDFSFVLIYFFPLIIIAFCFSIISEEKEDGTWSLILSQSENPQKMLRMKLFIRFLSVLAVLLLLFSIAKVYLDIPLDAAFSAFILVSMLYILFWFSLGWLVASFQKTSSQNAVILVFSWVLLAIVIPAIFTAVINYKLPVSETFKTLIDGREGYHAQWDKPKEETLQKFYDHYPQFSEYKLPPGDFNWLWYYAMQQSGDDMASEASKNLQEKLRQREAFSSTVGTIFPSMHTGITMSNLSKSGLKNYLDFGDELVKFHEKKRLYFYPKIFSEASASNENWKSFKLEYFNEKSNINWFQILLPLLLASLVGFIWAKRNVRSLI
ncbi:DUF3526 domain-containing protein [uncultured Arcticibacterium sp.]|uniref:DUF3526 domain-containing protein n=1 Tax=uncultured Arcticibacterium sp. TaxID=2173042 RepID=UPI0030F7EBF5